ncbi:hypothetical protein GCM10009093_13690 [Brevundimonas terrae]|uniref:Uncharacterized protein n=1 Tax=Brevundimonas terrae TaxID=363631 RepID=A0ABN0Y9S0_9CAUL
MTSVLAMWEKLIRATTEAEPIITPSKANSDLRPCVRKLARASPVSSIHTLPIKRSMDIYPVTV